VTLTVGNGLSRFVLEGDSDAFARPGTTPDANLRPLLQHEVVTENGRQTHFATNRSSEDK